ncbi:MAG TPA: hypothetical protein VLZ50_08010 [Terracidiphilus sp.]|nr:hypothetical protein [Terracidiphilus sp.]
MDHAALVSFDIEIGRRTVNALDESKRAPNVALWAKLPEYEDWRLVIASDRLNQESSRTAYEEINAALRSSNIPFHQRPTIFLKSMSSPMIEELRNVFGKAKDTYGMRLGGQTFGDQYIEDAFVYRIQ